MVTDKSKKPELRFKGFSDDWEQRKLGDIADVTKLAGFEFTEHIVYSDEGSIIALRGLNVKDGQLVLDDVKYIDGSNFSKLGRSKLYENDVLFTYVGTVGELAIVSENERFYLAPNVSRIRFQRGYDAQFMIQAMGSRTFYDNMIFPLIATSSQPALSMENIRKFIVSVPSDSAEQQEIGRYFLNLDNLITLHQRKCENLKIIKKSMLDNLFPKNGEKIPRWRFKGFNDDWEQRKLSNVAEIVGGGTPSTLNPDYWDGDIDWYAPAEIGKQIFANGSIRKITKDGLNHCSAKILPAYKTVLFTSRAGIGNMAILQRSAATNQGFQSLVCHDNIDPYFVFSMGDNIKIKAKHIAAGSTFAEISGKKLGALEFMFPDADEQKAIGAYFMSLDKLITLHQSEVERLKKVKQFFLDKMFI